MMERSQEESNALNSVLSQDLSLDRASVKQDEPNDSMGKNQDSKSNCSSEGNSEEEDDDNDSEQSTSGSTSDNSDSGTEGSNSTRGGDATNKSGSEEADESDNTESRSEPVKKKRKLSRRKKSSKSDKEKAQRKNIRQILREDQLEAETLAAQNEELERKKRLQELKKNLQKLIKTEEQDSQLKSLLQSAEDGAKKINDDIILLDSGDESKKKIVKDVIELSSDDDDVVMISSDKEEENDYGDDPNNSGSHVNDALNQADELGRVLVNVGHPADDPDIYLAPQIAKIVKPHQIGGIRFLYDNVIESLSRFNSSSGFGCILAHSMGLGKTIQLVGVIDLFLSHTGAQTVLCIVPINTLQNWIAEFNLWLPETRDGEPEDPDIHYRPFKLFVINDCHKTMLSRAKVLDEWQNVGGVLLLGYEMYRLLSSRKITIHSHKKKKKKSTEPEIIDIEEEDQNKILQSGIHKALVNPGPDLVVCDEGHRIKNSHAGISQSLKNIRTRRRIVLTGYPLQNNLLEYWCMVDFVRPNFLGTKAEFCNMFERPIMNGQCVDSTHEDLKLMRFRAHVLHSLLAGFIQRRGHAILQSTLPPKQEVVFQIRMSPIQRCLYKKFMDCINDCEMAGWANNNPLKAFSMCCKIWNHPDVIHKIMVQKKNLSEDNDLDLEPDGKVNSVSSGAKRRVPSVSKVQTNQSQNQNSNHTQTEGLCPFADKKSDTVISYDWVEKILENYVPGTLENGGKLVLLFNLIEQSIQCGDKILVFSQSLYTLNIIEEFLARWNVPLPDVDEKWCKNKNYFRLDGSTSGIDRAGLISQFNATDNTKVWLFLLSTRAGCLGINLIGANRVIVVDASWNPCHDCQAVCRVYRYGQEKSCFIYRLITDNTLEKKIYDRQINKQGMADRVVDELNPENHFTKQQVDSLLRYVDKDIPEVDFSNVKSKFTDSVLVNILENYGNWLTKEPFTHQSLLYDKKELQLTKYEKRLAKQSYVMEKKLSVNYGRQSYAAYYSKSNPNSCYLPNNQWPTGYHSHISRPVASVKPMVSTPVPLELSQLNYQMNKILQPGVSVHQVVNSTDIILPQGSNTTDGVDTIPAGEQVYVIKTPRGVYIRTKEGRIFAVRSKPSGQGYQCDETKPTSENSLSVGRTVSTTMPASVSVASSSSSSSSPTTQMSGSNPDQRMDNSSLFPSLVTNLNMNSVQETLPEKKDLNKVALGLSHAETLLQPQQPQPAIAVLPPNNSFTQQVGSSFDDIFVISDDESKLDNKRVLQDNAMVPLMNLQNTVADNSAALASLPSSSTEFSSCLLSNTSALNTSNFQPSLSNTQQIIGQRQVSINPTQTAPDNHPAIDQSPYSTSQIQLPPLQNPLMGMGNSGIPNLPLQQGMYGLPLSTYQYVLPQNLLMPSNNPNAMYLPMQNNTANIGPQQIASNPLAAISSMSTPSTLPLQQGFRSDSLAPHPSE